ncbi:hypothetical protein CTheo_8794 [Ceratobasidium theobromae]|uniref:Uncharacterized protein n=1 Tax=Ceratobasidium theobromae TaxID=1582974 RepID=A0A5N5Q8D9_9AGAM|nr:hypothetical protein CTheo_8794 [Ceratobasidium theobromae]
MPRKSTWNKAQQQNLAIAQAARQSNNHRPKDAPDLDEIQATNSLPPLSVNNHTVHVTPANEDQVSACTEQISFQSEPIDGPNDLAADLGNMRLKTTQGEDIILEDLPEDFEDFPGSQNLLSLADPIQDGENLPPCEPTEEADEDENKKRVNTQPIPIEEAKKMIVELDRVILTSFHGHGKTQVCSLGHVMLTQLQFMVRTLRLLVWKNLGLTDASLTAAVVFGWGEWAAQQVHTWIQAFQESNTIPSNVYGQWNGSVIEDEDLSSALQEWLCGKGKYVWARDIIDFFGLPENHAFSCLIEEPPSL